MADTAHVAGVLAEARAEQHLLDIGYTVLAQRVVSRGAEIDLIAQDGDVLVFIEVKARQSTRAGMAREAVTPAKQKRICKGALHYMAHHGLMNRQARFDVIEIQGGVLTHIKDAFPYCGPVF